MTKKYSTKHAKEHSEKQIQKKQTPLMQQYWQIKSAHTDKILLFRMGDFFEMFHEDAVTAAPILDIALTQRNKKAQDQTPMCGVPHHSIAGPINKLLSSGFKVAICDQVEDPKEAKGIVKRAVTRILSPGMVYDPSTLDENNTNYLCAFDKKTVSFLEPTTAEAFYYEVRSESQIQNLLEILQPAEVVLVSGQVDTWSPRLKGFFKTTHEALAENNEPDSARRLIDYARSMQGPEILDLLHGFECRKLKKRLELSATVVRHLEVFTNSRGERQGSLLSAIQRTKSSIGTRKLKQWLRFPLADRDEINGRLDEVSYWMQNPQLLKEVRDLFGQLGDIERRVGKASSPQFNVNDLLSVNESLRTGLLISEFLKRDLDSGLESKKELEKRRVKALNEVSQLVHRIDHTIADEAPANMKNGGFIKKGVDKKLDELITLSTDAQKCLRELESGEKEKTGISSLKIRYNNVFGYYIEVTNAHKDKVPSHYMRKQTLTNAERYATQELSELEEKILSAKTRRVELENTVFQELKSAILQAAAKILDLARLWSETDVYTSLAWLAIENNYCRPVLHQDWSLNIDGSRHPVVEQEVKEKFVPNDIHIPEHHCLMLTGPNMAGKSTLMRQVAISSILAQIGSYVPATRAEMPIFENIFTRIGASDFLAEGLSTFMVEMQETSEMLKSTNSRCLVVLDEVGRGTSTFDGMSLAQAILEYLVRKKKCMTLFATHYHELTRMEDSLPQIMNGHMTINEVEGEIRFLHTLKMGAASKSYGIQVARLAGLPLSVTTKARQILTELEQKNYNQQMSLLEFSGPSLIPEASSAPPTQEEQAQQELLRELRELSIQSVTPLEAMNKIAKWQETLS